MPLTGWTVDLKLMDFPSRLRVAEATNEATTSSQSKRPRILGSWASSGSRSFSFRRKAKQTAPTISGGNQALDENEEDPIAQYDANGELIVADLQGNEAPDNLWLPMISPQSPRAALWMCFTMVLLIYIAIMLPYRLGFADEVCSCTMIFS